MERLETLGGGWADSKVKCIPLKTLWSQHPTRCSKRPSPRYDGERRCSPDAERLFFNSYLPNSKSKGLIDEDAATDLILVLVREANGKGEAVEGMTLG